MDRQAGAVVSAVGAAWALAGCAGDGNCKVRETALPDARGVHAEAPSLLPAMPLASSGPTRGQAAEGPVVTRTAASDLPPPAGQVTVRIRAHVNGNPILDDELREAMVMRMGEVLALPEARRAAFFQELAGKELDRLIERELILQEAMEKIKEIKRPQLLEQLKTEASKEADRRLKEIKAATKKATDAEFRDFLKQSGLSVEGLRRQTERNFMMTEYVRNLIFPVVQRISVQQVRDYYEEHPDQFTRADRVKWLDVFVDASRFSDGAAARRHAEMIAQRARAGEDFAALAKQFDQGDSSLRNGEGLGQKRGEIKPAQAEAVLFTLKPGEVGPVIDLGFGCPHVVKVVERDYAGLEPLEEKVQAKVREKLRTVIAEREYKRIVDELKRTATIVVYPNSANFANSLAGYCPIYPVCLHCETTTRRTPGERPMSPRVLGIVLVTALAAAPAAPAALVLEYIQVNSITAPLSASPALAALTMVPGQDTFLQFALRDTVGSGPEYGQPGTVAWQTNGGNAGPGSLGLLGFFIQFDSVPGIAVNPAPTSSTNARTVNGTFYATVQGGTNPPTFTHFGGLLNVGFEPGDVPDPVTHRIGLFNLRVTPLAAGTGTLHLRDPNPFPNSQDNGLLLNADRGAQPNAGTAQSIDGMLFGANYLGTYDLPIVVPVPEPSGLAFAAAAVAVWWRRGRSAPAAK